MSTTAAVVQKDRVALPAFGSEHDYRARRSRALSLAARGSLTEALRELEGAWRAGNPRAADRALDLGWVRLLAGNPSEALEALWWPLRDGDRAPSDTYRLVAECVRADPSLREPALQLALAARSPLRRARIAVAALAARPSYDPRPEQDAA